MRAGAPSVTDPIVVDRMLAEFRQKAEPLGVAVRRVGDVTAAVAVLAEWAHALGANEAVVSDELTMRAPSLSDGLESSAILVRAAASPEETRDAPVGVSLAHLAVAETGSMLLSEPSLEDRSVGMLTLAQAIVCSISALVPTLDEAVPLLREIARGPGGSFSTFVTGPSRTADIERVLTVGVQGPGVVMTLFVDEL